MQVWCIHIFHDKVLTTPAIAVMFGSWSKQYPWTIASSPPGLLEAGITQLKVTSAHVPSYAATRDHFSHRFKPYSSSCMKKFIRYVYCLRLPLSGRGRRPNRYPFLVEKNATHSVTMQHPVNTLTAQQPGLNPCNDPVNPQSVKAGSNINASSKKRGTLLHAWSMLAF